nr:hypothetical protein [Tanacetum cinerariifolium]
MTTVNQGISVEEIKQIVAHRVANAIEAIAIYESINQTKHWENKVVGNASNKNKWEGVILTTLASVQQNVAIANGGATKKEIVCFLQKMRSLGKDHVFKQGRKKAKTGTNNEEEGVSAAGETFNAATLTRMKESNTYKRNTSEDNGFEIDS